MLPVVNRMRAPAEFVRTTRKGRRCGRTTLVVHLDVAGADGPPRVGFVVSKAVGTSVVRHRVTRRLRHAVRARLSRIPDGGRVVVRALPPAAAASSSLLAQDLDVAFDRLTGAGR